MFNFSCLKCYQTKLVFCVFVVIVTTNFSLSQASAVTDNNSDNSYKNKIYSRLDYMKIDSDTDIMFYGIGAETKLPNSTEIFYNYATGNARLKEDCMVNGRSFKKQKSTDRSHIGILSLKHQYNKFIFQADLRRVITENTFKIDGATTINGNSCVDATSSIYLYATFFVVKLSKKSKLNDNLYLLPRCSFSFNNILETCILKGRDNKTKKIVEKFLPDDESSGVSITPELIIGGDLFLPAAIKINPEMSFSYLFDTKYSSNNRLKINPKINIEINRLYIAIEAKFIPESDYRSALIKLGVLF